MDEPARRVENSGSASVAFGDAVAVWTKIGLLSFGGPAGQIALMHRLLVEEKRWIDEERFLHALNYCMLLPGPEAQQLATYVGWLLHRMRGGLAAGILFVLPGAVVMLLLSMLYARYHELEFTQAVFFGIKAAVLAVVIQAMVRIGSKALQAPIMPWITAASFFAIFVFNISFPLIVLAAGVVGFTCRWLAPGLVLSRRSVGGLDAAEAPSNLRVETQPIALPSLGRSMAVATVCVAAWFLPVVSVAVWLGSQSVYAQEGVFFSKMAVVTFGGAYAVLAYMAQQAVETYGWLEPSEMLDGLGLAETTPGPLIMVVQFVGFLAAYRNPGSLDPLLAGTFGALITTWVTFVPCFLWIFLGAPYIERLRGNRALSAALSAITAAVVGVIVNLALWFAMHVAFATLTSVNVAGTSVLLPELSSVQPAALALTAMALIAMLRFNVGLLPTLVVSALAGSIYSFAT